MSYDITLYPRQAGQDWPEVIEAAEAEDETLADDEAALTAGIEVFRRIETRLQVILDGPLKAWVAEETGGDVYGELTAADTGIEVALFDRGAEVSFTDSDSEDGRDYLHQQVRKAVEVVAKETGYVAYDPQTRASFDGIIRDADSLPPQPLDEGSADTDGMGPDGQPLTGETHQSEDAAAPAPHRNPVNLRRRGWIYMILGVVLIVLAAQRISSDNGGALTIALLVIGILDFLGGLFLLSVAKRGEQNQRPDVGETPAP